MTLESILEDKKKLGDLKDRFVAYIHRVRQLKDESDIKVIQQMVVSLEVEIQSMRSMYDFQLAEMQGRCEFLAREKMEQERDLALKKASETHLLDRLNVESSKNVKVVHELLVAQKEVDQKDLQIKTAQNSLKQAWLDFGELQTKHGQLTIELENSKEKIKVLETAKSDNEIRIQTLENKLAYEIKCSSAKVEELRCRIEKYVVQLTDMGALVEEAKHKEELLPGILSKAKETADKELEKFKAETESFYKQTLTSVQFQFDCEVQDKKHLKEECDRLNLRILELRKAETDLTTQVKSLEHQMSLMEETMRLEREAAAKSVNTLEVRLRQVQDSMADKLREVDSAKDMQISIREEQRQLSELLAEEEKRLRIGHSFTAGQTTVVESSQVITVTTTSETTEKVESSQKALPGIGFENIEKEIKGSGKVTATQKLSTSSQDHQKVSTISNLSADLYQVPETPRPSMSGVGEEEETHRGAVDAGEVTQALLEDKKKEKKVTQKKQPANKILDPSDTSFAGDLKFLEMNKDGKCLRVWNSNEQQDADFGNLMIQQCIGGHPVAMFRFPKRLRVPANSTVTVWSGVNDPLLHQPPTDFYWPDQPTWNTGPECTTLLCNSTGDVLAWTATAHRIGHDPYFVGSKSKIEDNDTSKLPELPQIQKSETLFMKRDKTMPVYSPNKHPHGTQPLSQVHPCTDSPRPRTWGNDNSSLNRQARSQTFIPDPAPGEPYTGTFYQKLGQGRLLRQYPVEIRRSGAIANRSVEIVVRAPMGPPSPFMKPHTRFLHGLDQMQSVQHSNYQPPIPRPMVTEW